MLSAEIKGSNRVLFWSCKFIVDKKIIHGLIFNLPHYFSFFIILEAWLHVTVEYKGICRIGFVL